MKVELDIMDIERLETPKFYHDKLGKLFEDTMNSIITPKEFIKLTKKERSEELSKIENINRQIAELVILETISKQKDTE